MTLTPFERRVVLLIGAVQFINILDFMMVMPLGPDFAAALGIAPSHIGYIGGSYTAAASIAGILGSMFLDRFDRRMALAVCLTGLVAATALGGLAVDFVTLLAARVMAGLFGGPAASLALSIVSDNVAVERRGRAMGLVMASFSLASVMGVPFGLELARMGGWRVPFFTVAGFSVIVALMALKLLPAQRAHLANASAVAEPVLLRLKHMLGERAVLLAYAIAVTGFMQSFMIVPNVAAYLQFNLGLPREQLGFVYLIGGAVSFFGMRFTGQMVDRFGASPMTWLTCAMVSLLIYFGFIAHWPLPVLLLFPMFMFFNSARNVANGTAFSKVPLPHERAGFMSLLSATQHMSMALGAFLSSEILGSAADGSLTNTRNLGIVAICIGALMPILMPLLERQLKRRAAASASLNSTPAPAAGVAD